MFFLIFAQFCSCLLYPSVTWQFVSHLLKELGLVDFPYSNADNQTIDESTDLARKWRLITMVGIFIFIMPFNLQKRLANLRYFSLAILLIVFFTIFVSFIQTPEYYKAYKDNDKYEMSWLARSPTIVWVQGFSTILLSYNCQITFFYVRGEMRMPSNRRVIKVVRNLLAVECLFYVIISAAGYISLGSEMIPSVFTLRRPLSTTPKIFLTE